MSYIDSRDLAAELDELHERPLSQFESGDLARMYALEALEPEIYEWSDGATLIPEDEFTDYARELAEDIGAMPDTDSWPARCIDWEQAANELRMDYTSVTFDGVDYLVRS